MDKKLKLTRYIIKDKKTDIFITTVPAFTPEEALKKIKQDKSLQISDISRLQVV